MPIKILNLESWLLFSAAEASYYMNQYLLAITWTNTYLLVIRPVGSKV